MSDDEILKARQNEYIAITKILDIPQDQKQKICSWLENLSMKQLDQFDRTLDNLGKAMSMTSKQEKTR